MGALTARRARWRAALITGLISGTFSTILITVGAPRIGRGRSLDWMEIGTVLLGAGSVVRDPAWTHIAAGIVVHQSADLLWALVFFGIAGRWTANRSLAALLGLGIPWAIATSAIEYYLILPWLQPLVPMQVPYWTALGVHLTSSVAYPIFPLIHANVLRRPTSHAGSARRWAYGLAVAVVIFAAIEAAVRLDWEPRVEVVRNSAAFDRTFMRHMKAHHEVGVRLADLSATLAGRDEVKDLGRLMVANQNAEIQILDGWWRRWFGGSIPEVSVHEHHTIPGMPSEEDMARLAASQTTEFEQRFFPIMTAHHAGAVMMADEAWRRAGDPRLRVYADSLRHAQNGQIVRMRRLHEELNNGKSTARVR